MCLLAMNSLYNEKGQWLVPLVWRKNIYTFCFKDNIILQRENLNHLIVCFTQCLFNMLGICTVGNCVSLLQGFWEHKSGIKYPPTRTFFLTCFLHTLYESFTGQILTSLGLSMFTGIACRLQLWIKTSNLENSISSTCWITSKFSSVCLQTCSSTFPILRPTYNLWNKIFIFLKLRHISNEDTLGSVPLVSTRLTENVDQYIRSINRELKQWRRRRQREWHKNNRFGSIKQQLCVTITFIVHFLPLVAQLRHETSHFHVLWRT